MPIGEPWPWGRWHGAPYPYPHAVPWWGVTPPPNPWAPQPRIVTTANTLSSIVPRDHKCTVRTSPFDRSLWIVHCRRCGFSTTSRDRDSALDGALGHRYFAIDPQMRNEVTS